jgi:centromere protein X
MRPSRAASSASRGRDSVKGRQSRGGTGQAGAKEPAEPQDISSASSASEGEADEARAKVTIPVDLLTRLLHEFFDGDRTRITRDANAAVAKYMDVFVREAIARAAAERERGFLEVCCFN